MEDKVSRSCRTVIAGEGDQEGRDRRERVGEEVQDVGAGGRKSRLE